MEIEKLLKNKVKKGVGRKNYWQIYTLLAIPLIYLFIFNYLPMFGIVIAFKNYKFDLGILGSEWVGFENFKFLFLSNDFMKVVRNTLCMNLLFIIFGVSLAILVAVLFFELKSRRATKIYETIMITPNFVSWVIVGYITYALFQPKTGAFNNIFAAFGLKTIDWYNTPSVWPAILLIASLWKHTGMDCVVYYAALMGVDESLMEAASLDGANKVQRIWHIMIPSILPTIVILVILKIGGIFRADFGLFYQLTRDSGTLYEVTDVLDTYVYRTMKVIGDMGLSSAAGLLQSVVGMILVIITNHLSKKIEDVGGLF